LLECLKNDSAACNSQGKQMDSSERGNGSGKLAQKKSKLGLDKSVEV
jgi:hypothetical protein